MITPQLRTFVLNCILSQMIMMYKYQSCMITSQYHTYREPCKGWRIPSETSPPHSSRLLIRMEGVYSSVISIDIAGALQCYAFFVGCSDFEGCITEVVPLMWIAHISACNDRCPIELEPTFIVCARISVMIPAMDLITMRCYVFSVNLQTHAFDGFGSTGKPSTLYRLSSL